MLPNFFLVIPIKHPLQWIHFIESHNYSGSLDHFVQVYSSSFSLIKTGPSNGFLEKCHGFSHLLVKKACTHLETWLQAYMGQD